MKGYLPCDFSIYQGAEATLQGELRANNITVHVEGVLKNVENMTVVNGGTCSCIFVTSIALHSNLHEGYLYHGYI